MCPAGLTDYIRQIVISLVPVCHQVAFESLQEFLGIVFCPGFCVMVEDEWRKSILSAPEQPQESILIR